MIEMNAVQTHAAKVGQSGEPHQLTMDWCDLLLPGHRLYAIVPVEAPEHGTPVLLVEADTPGNAAQFGAQRCGWHYVMVCLVVHFEAREDGEQHIRYIAGCQDYDWTGRAGRYDDYTGIFLPGETRPHEHFGAHTIYPAFV